MAKDFETYFFGRDKNIKIILDMVNPHLEKIFFKNIINNADYIQSTHDRYFDDNTLRKLFPKVKEFYTRYKETPTLAQVTEIVKIAGLEDISVNQLESIWGVNLKEYDEQWLKENTETYIEYKTLDSSTMDLVSYLKTTPVNTDNIKDVVNTAKNIITSKNNIDFTFTEGSSFFDPESHIQPTYNTFSTGYPFIDLAAGGGFTSKSLVCLIGAAKVGKCQHFDEYIAVRSKRTGLIQKIKIGEFHEKLIGRNKK